MPVLNKYPQRIQRELVNLADEFILSKKTPKILERFYADEMFLLRAALICLDFEPTSMGGASVGQPELRGVYGAPYVCIGSKQARELLAKEKRLNEWWADKDNKEKNAFVAKMRQLNLEEVARMLDLLDEFYKHHSSPSESVHLILMQRDWLGEFQVGCQGVNVARLPQRKAEYPAWVAYAQAEIRAFAEYLCTKVVD
jgi:hypothetical protein